LNGSGVEVGVWRGDFSMEIISRSLLSRLYLVDPWCKLDDYDDVRNRDFDPSDYLFVHERFCKLRHKVSIVKSTSLSASRNLPNCLDFVYIDANHEYEYVLQDLSIWWPKIRVGGVLAGHDVFSLNHPGVTAAVAKFAIDNGLTIDLIPGDFNKGGMLVNAHSWYVVKS